MKKIMFLISICSLLISCSPEVGSKKWCENLEKKPKGEWTVNEAKDYAKYCVFR